VVSDLLAGAAALAAVAEKLRVNGVDVCIAEELQVIKPIIRNKTHHIYMDMCKKTSDLIPICIFNPHI
jgi:hypothetical protein